MPIDECQCQWRKQYEEGQMVKKQWVQHISGQGEKWEVRDGVKAENTWCVAAKNEHDGYHWLPKSEYRLCDPPEVWRDVTEECEVNGLGEILHGDSLTLPGHGYRRRKVQLETPHKCGKTLASIVWAFIVEQKVTE